MITDSNSEVDGKANKFEEKGAEGRVSGDSSVVELDLEASKTEADVGIVENGGSEEEGKARVRISEEGDVDKEIEEEDEEEESRVFDVEENDPPDDKFDVVTSGDLKVEVYKSLLSEFEDYVANEKDGAMVATTRALRYGFEVGDLVWGKVKSHPWWPGHIYNEAFASSSVRRTRREGHVLVAFFGDSSYGWFDPAELIPFDPNFTEKSQQTNSRNFVKAVEEAVDEASRRCGLALVCRCRNPKNLRPTNVQGYFSVDVPDFEAGGIYSVDQINKARDEFLPGETLAFVKQLASAPQDCARNTMNFVKNKAMVFAFRKAVFEEYDETYAQAFGTQTSKPSNVTTNVSDQTVKEPTRAPLTGPLVIAEALGSGKSSKKPMKAKDQSKKDRYLFKRRDEASDSRMTLQSSQKQASSTPAAYVESASGITSGEYVLQKRAPVPQTSARHEQVGFISKEGLVPSEGGFTSKEGLVPSEGGSGKDSGMLDQTPGYLGAQARRDTLDSDKVATKEAVDSTSTGLSDVSGKGVLLGATDRVSPSLPQEVEAMLDVRYENNGEVFKSSEGSQTIEPSFSAKLKENSGMDNVLEGIPGLNISSLDVKRSVVSADGVVKKAKVLKRPLKDLSSENSSMGEKKKKKKKMMGVEPAPDRPKKHSAIRKVGITVGNSTGKSTAISVALRQEPLVNQQKKDIGVCNSSNGVGTLPMASAENNEMELSQLLSDLHALALNPFHGIERNRPAIIMQCFLRFRALVYQKSLVLSPPSETESVETSINKSTSSIGPSDNSIGENVRCPPSKPAKSTVRPDDPTKAGRKRMPSDRQEEIAAKKFKKMNQLKSLAAERKVVQRTLEIQRSDRKEPMAATPSRPFRPDSVKKMEPSSRAVEPTMLVMKFPPQTSLPSGAELKAKFARFGSIDQSAIRVFWQSSQCRVVFRYKQDAQAAYKYAVGNNSLFGNVNVRYSLREVGAPATEAPELDKSRGDDIYAETLRAKDPVTERPAPALVQQHLPQLSGQLKSILKKPTGDEAGGQVTGGNGGAGGGGRGTTRVKFMLSGEESSSSGRGEQLMVGNRNNFNNNNNKASFADGGASSITTITAVAMDYNSKKFQKVIPPSTSSPILPLPSQFAKPSAPLNNSHHTEALSPRDLHNSNMPHNDAPSIDISQQMLSLLSRCNEVVTSVTGLLGYVPYHPL